MNEVWLYSLVSALIISLASLVGIFTLGIKVEKLKKILIYLVSFSAGALLGDAFIHLIPESIEQFGGSFTVSLSISILGGLLIFFILEKVVCWQHCHMPITREHVHPFSYMVLIGDSIHNFLDGLIIAGSYLVSLPVGMATTLAVLFHEIPQEIGEFGILLHGGFKRKKALLMNFLTALTIIIGAAVGIILSTFIGGLQKFLIPLAIGGFLYIAGSDLIPELHKETQIKQSLIQIAFFIIGILIMLSLILLE